MRSIHLLLAGAATGFCALTAPAAFATCAPTDTGTPACVAGRSSTIANDQVRLDTAFADLQLTVHDAPTVAGAATAAGNTVGLDSAGRAALLQSSQRLHGAAAATSTVRVDGTDHLANAATATGNGLAASTQRADLTVEGFQQAQGGPIRATATTTARAVIDSVTAATAGANVATVAHQTGTNRLRLTQEADTTVEARAEADHCCVAGTAATSALASANSVAVTGETSTTVVAAYQTADGSSVSATSDIYAGLGGTLVSSATANGNSLTVGNVWGWTDVVAVQDNASTITANAYATAGGDGVRGAVAANAYGVGNSVVASNASSDLRLNVHQVNTGGVITSAATSGISGLGGQASATSIGNLTSGTLCSVCGGGLITATNIQRSQGFIGAYTTVVSPAPSGSVAGSATAIGNAATFRVTDGHP